MVWRNHRNLAWNCAGSCDKMKEGENNFKFAKAQKESLQEQTERRKAA